MNPDKVLDPPAQTALLSTLRATVLMVQTMQRNRYESRRDNAHG